MELDEEEKNQLRWFKSMAKKYEYDIEYAIKYTEQTLQELKCLKTKLEIYNKEFNEFANYEIMNY